MEIHNYTSRPGEDVAADISPAIHATLERVLEWGRNHPTPVEVAEIVTQDEYTHDVIIPYDNGMVLAYDTT